MYVEKYAYIYLLKWASFLDPLHCNEQQKWWRVRPQLRYVKSSVTSFFEKKVTCSPLRWTFLHLKTILGMIAHKINLKMTHAGIFSFYFFFRFLRWEMMMMESLAKALRASDDIVVLDFCYTVGNFMTKLWTKFFCTVGNFMKNLSQYEILYLSSCYYI